MISSRNSMKLIQLSINSSPEQGMYITVFTLVLSTWETKEVKKKIE